MSARFIALRNFLNVPLLAIDVPQLGKDGKPEVGPDGKPTNAMAKEIVRGREFTLGTGEATADLTQLSPADQTKARHLLTNAAIFADNPANKGRLETLKRQLDAEAAQRAREAAKGPPLTLEDVLSKMSMMAESMANLAGQVLELKTGKTAKA